MTTATTAAGPRSRLALVWGAAALALVAAAPLAPILAAWVPPCPWKAMTGVACPGCGTTRAALALAALDPLGALVRYPLPTLLWAGVVAGGLVTGAASLLGRRLPRPASPWPRPVRWGLVAALVANWAYSIATGV